jgi:hypothetical protein
MTFILKRKRMKRFCRQASIGFIGRRPPGTLIRSCRIAPGCGNSAECR